MRFSNGMVGHLTSSYDIERGHPMERCEVAGTRGRLVIEDMWREATLYPAGNLEKRVFTNPVFGGFRDFEDTFRDRITSFVRQVAAGVAPEEIDGSGAQGLEASRVIHAAIQLAEDRPAGQGRRHHGVRRGSTMALKVGIVGMGGIGNTHARCYTAGQPGGTCRASAT